MSGSTDQIEQIVTALTGCCAECADRAEHIAYAILEHAPAGLLDNPLSVDIEATATGQRCTVKHTGVTIFKGVSLEATMTTEAHDRKVAGQALREAQGDIRARIQIMRSCGANSQYINALHDAWSLLNNRVRGTS